MHSSFYFPSFMKNFLFNGVNINTTWGMVSMCVGLASLAALLEGLKTGKMLFNIHDTRRTCKITEKTPLLTLNSGVQQQFRIKCDHNGKTCQQERIVYHILGTLVYVVGFVINYILMLSVMTFNAYFMIAAVCGSTLGYLCFGFFVFPSFPVRKPQAFQIGEDENRQQEDTGSENRISERVGLHRQGYHSYGACGGTSRSDVDTSERIADEKKSESTGVQDLKKNLSSCLEKVHTEEGSNQNGSYVNSNVLEVAAEIHVHRDAESI